MNVAEIVLQSSMNIASKVLRTSAIFARMEFQSAIKIDGKVLQGSGKFAGIAMQNSANIKIKFAIFSKIEIVGFLICL